MRKREREVSYSLTAYSTDIHALSTLCSHLVHASKTLELTETSCYSVGKAMSYLLYLGVLQRHDHTARIVKGVPSQSDSYISKFAGQ